MTGVSYIYRNVWMWRCIKTSRLIHKHKYSNTNSYRHRHSYSDGYRDTCSFMWSYFINVSSDRQTNEQTLTHTQDLSTQILKSITTDTNTLTLCRVEHIPTIYA